MCPGEVRLLPAAQRALECAVRTAWPREAAAVLGGRRIGACAHIDQVVPIDGAGDRLGFVVTPAAFAAAAASIRAADGAWLGFAHSHPGGTAAPSARDRDELWRGCVQVIVGGVRPDDLQLAAFWFDGEHGVPVSVSVQPASAEATA